MEGHEAGTEVSASKESDFDADPLAGSELDQSLPNRQASGQYYHGEDEDEYNPKDDDLQSLSPPEAARQANNPIAVSDSPPGANDSTAPLLTGNPFAQYPSYLTRPNRWYGPDSTWLSWTEEDRLAARSLDRVRSQDLSLHLYNAYALNANAKISKEARRKRLKGKEPVRPLEGLGDDQAETLEPPRGWTAWPLPPDQVPRECLFPEISGVTVYRKQEGLQLSKELEECLIATTTRLARERWQERTWQSESVPKKDRMTKIEAGEQDSALEASPEPSSEEQNATETIISDSDSTSDNAGDEVYTSQAYDLALDDGEIKDTEELGTVPDFLHNARPVPIADDEIARDLLLPSIRSALAKLDDLLMGLHQARQAYVSASSRRKRNRVLGEDSAITTEAESESAPLKISGRERKRRRAASIISTRSTGSGSTAFDEPQRETAQKRKPNPRNWSDVIGIAALTGWNSDVIARASQRCATLFDENMVFRTFHEGDKSKKLLSYFTEHDAIDAEEFFEYDTRNESSVAMIRTSKACERCHTNKEKCEALDGAEGNGPCKKCTHVGLACSGITVKIYKDIGRSCPHRDCERHSIPFRRAGQLQRHLDLVHQHDILQQEAPQLSLPSPAQSSEQTQSVEIICPIPTCQRHKQPFSRGTKLYDHIRNMHPEIDVQEIKKLESARRGEKRGRYRDESRRREIGRTNRSRSKSAAPRVESEG